MTQRKKPKQDDIVAEGLYIASAATRLTLKNRILVDLLTGAEGFEVARFLPDARETLLNLAAEAQADAERAERDRKAARGRHTDSDGTHDYRSRDVRNLRKRRKQSEKIAKELRERAEDPEELTRLVDDARDAAWAEVAKNIDRNLRIEAARPDLDPDYQTMRQARMQALRMVDLPRLRAHRRAVDQAAAERADAAETR
ncbi:asparagine synthase [Microbacterium sp. zg.Y1090]|uniref:asparagine synthase n=1 Tax=Microbacterium TaxID=33882 RepID=UPI00214CA492|nr:MULTISPECIES: asparagine synthase [unclassified Microbacterium]MCR2812435.1 asparagine synthase [Microbacterium sp. zg.Y1084]MCR2817764.1 asparagine synthase [Microbacterium sp. zg.Y1090]MDL5485592.1 asparagine synthase [Microbacterium sp. zg-Y1211]WIM28763.1 asparagine synthase [Microbacterium sp. zg-Y1090]